MECHFSICNKFKREKEAIHKKCDPPFLKPLSLLFDVRNWKASVFDSETTLTNLKEQFEAALLTHSNFFMVLI